MKDNNHVKDIWEKILGLGKDRYIILLCIGLAFVLIAATLENGKQEKNNGKLNAQRNEKTSSELNNGGDDEESLFSQADRWNLSGLTSENKEGGSDNGNSSVTELSMVNYEVYYQRQLENLLSKMDGIGKVSVVVNLQSSEELILERNNPYNRKTQEETAGQEQSRSTEIESDSQVVFYENESGKNTPIVVKRCAPKIGGVVVLAQGADNPGVTEKITQLLVALFDIPEHKIKVAKYRT